LQDIISENILPAKSRIKNSFEFHNKLTGIDKTIDKTEMILLDVTSLFINISLDVVWMDWVLLKVSQTYQRMNSLMVKFIFTSTFHYFNGIIYKQTFGIPIGSPFPHHF